MSRCASRVVLILAVLHITAGFGQDGRASTIDVVAPVSPGRLEIELGYSHRLPHQCGRDQKWPVFGLLDGLEFGLAIPRVNYDDAKNVPKNGFEDLQVNAHFKFLDEVANFPALAAALDLEAPTANRSKGLSTGKTDETLAPEANLASNRFRSRNQFPCCGPRDVIV